MAFNDFKRRDTGSAQAPATAGGVGALTAFIDQGSEFTGKLSFKDTVRIDGRFEGEISSENTLIVGETGHVQANITSAVVIVSGSVDGDIKATDQITLHKTAVICGDIEAKRLVMEDGAKIDGQVRMGAANRTQQPGRPAEKSAPASDKPPSQGAPSA